MFNSASIPRPMMPSSSGREINDAGREDVRGVPPRGSHAEPVTARRGRAYVRGSTNGVQWPSAAHAAYSASDSMGDGQGEDMWRRDAPSNFAGHGDSVAATFSGPEAELREIQMRKMADRIEELESIIAGAERTKEVHTGERFVRIAGEIAQAVALVQQLQLHIFPKFANSGKERAVDGADEDAGDEAFAYDRDACVASSIRAEQHAFSEIERLNRSLVMLRMIVDAKLETVHTLRTQSQKEAQEAHFMMREERQAAAEAREALAKLEASTWQEREALRLDVDSLKSMYEDELGRFRSRVDDAETTAAASEAKLSAAEQHLKRLSEMFEEEQQQREGLERQLMGEQQAHHDSIVSIRMLEQENAGLKAELVSLRGALDATTATTTHPKSASPLPSTATSAPGL